MWARGGWERGRGGRVNKLIFSPPSFLFYLHDISGGQAVFFLFFFKKKGGSSTPRPECRPPRGGVGFWVVGWVRGLKKFWKRGEKGGGLMGKVWGKARGTRAKGIRIKYMSKGIWLGFLLHGHSLCLFLKQGKDLRVRSTMAKTQTIFF